MSVAMVLSKNEVYNYGDFAQKIASDLYNQSSGL